MAATATAFGGRQSTGQTICLPAAVMNVRRFTRDGHDELVEVALAVYLGDKYDYVGQLERGVHGHVPGGLISTGSSA